MLLVGSLDHALPCEGLYYYTLAVGSVAAAAAVVVFFALPHDRRWCVHRDSVRHDRDIHEDHPDPDQESCYPNRFQLTHYYWTGNFSTHPEGIWDLNAYFPRLGIVCQALRGVHS